MSKLKEEKFLKKWARECSYNHDCHDCKDAPECGQVYVQIRKMIQKLGVDKGKLRIKPERMDHLEIGASIGKPREAPKVTEKFIAEKINLKGGKIGKRHCLRAYRGGANG